MKKSGKIHRLIASPKTVHTGFFDAALCPLFSPLNPGTPW